jgi:hypothetical protein
MTASFAIDAVMHGWPRALFSFGATQLPLAGAMIRGRAAWHRVLLSPLIAAPLTGLAAVVTAGPGLFNLALSAGLGAGLGYVGGRMLTRESAQPTWHQRGTVIASSAQTQSLPATAKARGAALTLAGVPLAVEDEVKHFKIIGTTGTGKSTAISELLSGALKRGDRAIIADPDGGYLRRFYDSARGDIILNPFDQRSVRWDLFAELRQSYDIDQLARSLIPDAGGSERIWRAYARTFFSAVTRQAQAAGMSDVADLYRLLVVAGHEELRTLTRGTAAQPFLEQHNGTMFDSIRSVSSSAVAALGYIADQRAPAFSLRDWVQTDGPGSVLFIPYGAGQIAALSSTISAWMRLAIFSAMERPEQDHRLWFVVDELDALGPIDGLKDALARLRKFGGRCVLGLQSIAQAASCYGAGDAHTIIENCGNTLILRCSASEGGGTARFASSLIGQREIRRTIISHSQRVGELLGSITRGEHVTVEAAVMDSEIEQLPDLCGFMKLASRPQWLPVRLQHPAQQRAGFAETAAFVPVVQPARTPGPAPGAALQQPMAERPAPPRPTRVVRRKRGASATARSRINDQSAGLPQDRGGPAPDKGLDVGGWER